MLASILLAVLLFIVVGLVGILINSARRAGKSYWENKWPALKVLGNIAVAASECLKWSAFLIQDLTEGVMERRSSTVDVRHIAEVADLRREVGNMVNDFRIDTFYIGRTGDLRRRASQHRCDNLVPVYGPATLGLAMDVESALIQRLFDHPKCTNAAHSPSGGVPEYGPSYVYVAVWYRRRSYHHRRSYDHIVPWWHYRLFRRKERNNGTM